MIIHTLMWIYYGLMKLLMVILQMIRIHTGDSTFSITSRSANNHAGSGRHNWGTYTDTSREVFTVPALAGTHQMVLHTALHGVSTNDNALNISVGYVAC